MDAGTIEMTGPDSKSIADLLYYVREYVTGEVAAYGSCDCDCDTTKGQTPCVYCAAIHFNNNPIVSKLWDKHNPNI